MLDNVTDKKTVLLAEDDALLRNALEEKLSHEGFTVHVARNGEECLMKAFELHPDLQRDGFVIGDFPLCRMLAINDATYPWFVLVPRRAGLRELYELTDADRLLFMRESTTLARQIAVEFNADKMNVAADIFLLQMFFSGFLCDEKKICNFIDRNTI